MFLARVAKLDKVMDGVPIRVWVKRICDVPDETYVLMVIITDLKCLGWEL